ncbi:DUF3243 domain-containing protein [Paenibacillus albiflavus]|uniref:DUF3243 domain-containing protein n=1 Tax=Paenibacillus albiflavus TaxID=2545760 RepID=A0A4R4EIN7_9BACL|nr:DUF3243 domain-containing protein [Paenibacillus albiflavus]TCZ80024.1 DUF3243 domain-containing protein [Paenibacillus albiflavus]
MSVMNVFDKWKDFLGDKIDQAERSGMGDEMINKAAYHIGDFLSDKVEPKNSEEKVLKDLWDAGSEDEQRTLARLMVKMVDK